MSQSEPVRQTIPDDTGDDRVRARLAELEAIYATAPIGLCIIDRDLRFVRMNAQMAEMNGHPAEAHIGRRVRDMVPDLEGQAEAMLRSVMTTGQPVYDIEITGQTPAQPGVARTWIEHWTPVFDDRGEVIAVSVVAEEITERKRAEEQLRQNAAAAREAAVRHQVLLRELNHRVKNSLALVAGLLDLQRSRTGGEAAAALEVAAQRIMTVAEIHRSLYVADVADRVDLSAVLEEIVGQTRPLAPGLDIAVEIGEAPRLSTDQALPVGLIVNELLTNAVKHAFDIGDHGRIVVRVEREAPRWRITVADDGRGLPEDWSADSRGLGASLLHGLAGQIGTELSVDSGPGRGTRIGFTLAEPQDDAE